MGKIEGKFTAFLSWARHPDLPNPSVTVYKQSQL